jgi:hypothetical protein
LKKSHISINVLKKGLLIALLVFMAIMLSSSAPVPESSSWPAIHLSDRQRAQIQTGDLIFRRAEGSVSEYILSMDTESEFSHSGLIRKQGDKITVLNASFKESEVLPVVNEIDLDSFLFGVSQAAIYRLRLDPGGVPERALQIAESYMGTPFDFKFNKDDSSSLYCTELVWLVYKQAGIDLLNGRFSELDLPMLGRGYFILPSDITNSTYLYQVMYLKSNE